jgi:hypothetical protein
MLKRARKWIALLLLVWMPVSGASVLAQSVFMQFGQGGCHEAAMPGIDGHDMYHHDASQAVPDQPADESLPAAHNYCGVCHLACSAYLTMPEVGMSAPAAVSTAIPYVFSFCSITSTPLVPPPITRS